MSYASGRGEKVRAGHLLLEISVLVTVGRKPCPAEWSVGPYRKTLLPSRLSGTRTPWTFSRDCMVEPWELLEAAGR